jgi:hypothetical protein
MLHLNKSPLPILTLFCFILVGCERNNTVCPPEEASQPALQLAGSIENPLAPEPSGPVQVEIRGKLMEVNKVVDYPLCNDNWSGTVYVSCEAQIAEWDPDVGSRFFEDCQLEIEPGTVVYVAAHNDEPLYKGCSCHTGEVYEHNR